MIIATTSVSIRKILAGLCLPMPDGSGYSTAALTARQLANLCTAMSQEKYRGAWSVSFADLPPVPRSYADLVEEMDSKTEQAFLLSPGFIGADSEDLIYFVEAVYCQPVTMSTYPRVAQLFRFWYAATYPDEYCDPPEPGDSALLELNLRYDGAENRNRRTRKRDAELRAAFAAKGWDSPSAVLTAMKNGLVEIPWNPQKENGND